MSNEMYKVYIEFLTLEIAVLESRLEKTGTGHIHTAISVLKDRVKELEEKE
tara:strand:+ start:109 stop:261 length:153 start_codon:yes stop_codon:yes gene_type:complete